MNIVMVIISYYYYCCCCYCCYYYCSAGVVYIFIVSHVCCERFLYKFLDRVSLIQGYKCYPIVYRLSMFSVTAGLLFSLKQGVRSLGGLKPQLSYNIPWLPLLITPVV